MSHLSTPRKARSKSPSCHEEGETGESEGHFSSVYDGMEAQVDEEFDSSAGLLKTTSNLVAHTRGSRMTDGSPVRNVSFPKYESPCSLKDSNFLQVPSFNTRSPSASRCRSANLGTTQPNQRNWTKQPLFHQTIDSDQPTCDFEIDDGLKGLDETTYMDVVLNRTSLDQTRANANSVNFSMSRQQCNDSRSMMGQRTGPGLRDVTGPTSSKCYSPGAAPGMVRPESCAGAGSLAFDTSLMARQQQFSYNDENPLDNTCRSDSSRYLSKREDTSCGLDTSRVSARSPIPGPRVNLNQTSGTPGTFLDNTCRSDTSRYLHKREDTTCGLDTSRVSARSPVPGPRVNLNQTPGMPGTFLDNTCRSDSSRYLSKREDAACGLDTSTVSSRSPVPGPRVKLNQTPGQPLNNTCRSDSSRYLSKREDTTCGLDKSRVSARSPVLGPSDNLNQTFGQPLDNTCRSDSSRYLSKREDTTCGLDKSRVSARSPVLGPRDNLNQTPKQPTCPQDRYGGHRTLLNRTQADQSYFRSPQTPSNAHSHHHHDTWVDGEPRRDERKAAALAHLSQPNKTSSSVACGVNQSVDHLSVCSSKAAKGNKLPEMPRLDTCQLAELIRSERQDVESAEYLTSEERKLYKKPCPKQQRAQMNVAALVKGHTSQTCGEKYTPLEHPDPEDITPEMAANMMFSQEMGIRLDGSPKEIITHLFPDEVKQSFPDKIQRSSISVVDSYQKNREVMIEKSAGVPSEGVSDSAYTRTMKEKGEELAAQKSYDVNIAIGQSKREYVLVAQKPQRISKVQFRGGNLPSWFPGYFCAFPDEDGIKEISSPSELFHKAWIHANPRNMPPNDVIVLD